MSHPFLPERHAVTSLRCCITVLTLTCLVALASYARPEPVAAATGKPVAVNYDLIFFANPGKAFKSGDPVTVVTGDYLFPHLKVL